MNRQGGSGKTRRSGRVGNKRMTVWKICHVFVIMNSRLASDDSEDEIVAMKSVEECVYHTTIRKEGGRWTGNWSRWLCNQNTNRRKRGLTEGRREKVITCPICWQKKAGTRRKGGWRNVSKQPFYKWTTAKVIMWTNGNWRYETERVNSATKMTNKVIVSNNDDTIKWLKKSVAKNRCNQNFENKREMGYRN